MGLPVRLFLLTTAAISIAQTPHSETLPRAPGAALVEISPRGGTYSEPSVAFDLIHPERLLVVYQVGGFAAYSTDAGKSFQLSNNSRPTGYRMTGDVSTAFDNLGHAFLCYLAFDHLGTSEYWAHAAGRNGIYVRRSLDGGKSWDKDSIAVKAYPTGHEPDLNFEDQPRIFADTGPRSRYRGNLYVGWIEWQMNQSLILFSRSIDDGRSWSPALRISTHAGLPRDDNGSVGGFVQAVAPDGAIYAAWHDGNQITFTESHDGGQTFSPSRPIIETAPPYFSDVTGVYRVDGFPQIAIDPQDRRLYVTWSDYRNGDIDVFLASSSDRGRHWSPPIRVNDDPLHDGTDQFFQWLAVDEATGDVYVQFYDRRADSGNIKIGFTLARSTDGGRSFKNYAWSENSFEAKGAFLGDYTWLAAYNHRVYGVWTEALPNVMAQVAPGAEPSEAPRISTLIRFGSADFSTTR
ncbi:MAG: exo-alpha-sialidase [Acidobacteriaceae bacterium]|nr:exo-alpha-sialidase [Acidobacteriaceae bacterium]